MLILVIYLVLELFVFYRKLNIITIVGMIVLIVSFGTFLMGWWGLPSNNVNSDNGVIDSKIIFIVSILSIMIVIGDLLATYLSHKKWISRFTTIFWSLVGILLFMLLIVDSSLIEERFSQVNTDFLSIVALGTSLLTIGVKSQLLEE